jgi:hypothetical protein
VHTEHPNILLHALVFPPMTFVGAIVVSCVQIRSFKNNLVNSRSGALTSSVSRAIKVPIPKRNEPTFHTSTDTASASRILPSADSDMVYIPAAAYESTDPNDYHLADAAWLHVQQAYTYSRTFEHSASGAVLPVCAVFPDNSTKMKQSHCNAICDTRVALLLRQAHTSYREGVSTVWMADPQGTMEIIKDLSVLNKIMTEARYLFVSPDDKRLQMMDDILLKFKRQKALIAAFTPGMTARERKRLFFSEENMYELERLAGSSKHFLVQLKERCTALSGGVPLRHQPGACLQATLQYVVELELLVHLRH